jgi:hypothetical protein
VKAFLKEQLNMVPRKEITDSELPFNQGSFQKNKADVMRAVFDVDQFETENRKFVDEVKPNSYALPVTMKCLVTTTSVVAEEPMTSRKKRKKNEGSVVQMTPATKTMKSREDLADGVDFSKELFKLGPGYCPDVLVGIDQGMRSLVTAVSVGRRRHRRRQRQSRRARRRSRQRRQLQERVTEITTREYMHLARSNDFRRYNDKLKQWGPWYAGVLHAMPSFKTCSYNAYLQGLQFFWMHLRFLLAFSAEQAFLRWRFSRERAKMKAIDALAKRLVLKSSKPVCIAYGDWSRRDGIKSHATGLVKGFVKALKKRATVLPMDEYRTSVTCSCCHQRLQQARLFNKVKRKDDDDDIRLKPQPSKKEAKGWPFSGCWYGASRFGCT